MAEKPKGRWAQHSLKAHRMLNLCHVSCHVPGAGASFSCSFVSKGLSATSFQISKHTRQMPRERM
eukprot:2306382-Amphidinium_carterae.1